MAFEKIKAGLEKYHADVEAKLAKFPERANLVPNRLYTPVDLGENFDYMENWVSLVNILTLVVFNLLCIVVVSGPCVCMLVSPPLKNPTNVIVTC